MGAVAGAGSPIVGSAPGCKSRRSLKDVSKKVKAYQYCVYQVDVCIFFVA
jgi:hypothetical protein